MTSVWRSLADVPRDLGPTVVTVGNFDGVHKGHQAVLAELVAAARARGAKAIAVTFDPHPKAVHAPDHQPELIT
ncbi:MAG: bifunctional riboflavin kinase/FAD synthetase, partial [Demequinaceae bacterium]|nr:bifunctional riboflavin kinase/FAD synthetase [Demequinaceae bacterium]